MKGGEIIFFCVMQNSRDHYLLGTLQLESADEIVCK